MNILVINGPNLNVLSKRGSEYGNITYENLVDYINDFAKKLNIDIDIVQTNYEGQIIEYIQQADEKYDALVINPGAFSHYSYAIYDALLLTSIPKIEVHLSDVLNREDFRKVLITSKACDRIISGYFENSYKMALEILGEKNDRI